MTKVKDLRFKKTIEKFSLKTIKYPLKIRIDNDLQETIEVEVTNSTHQPNPHSSDLGYFDEGIIIRIRKKEDQEK